MQDLVDRAGGRAEVLVHFSATQGYQVFTWNHTAVELFDLTAVPAGLAPLSWGELPASLAEYLSQALQVVSGAPEEAMPGFKNPLKPERSYFAKVFYECEPGTEETEEGHWYLFCFQDSVNWLDNSQGAATPGAGPGFSD